VSWVLTFVGISVLVVIHEAGHFAAAKAVGMRVERFSLFFGPMIVKFKVGETVYGIGCIPLGGYVKIAGMTPVEAPAPAPGAEPAIASSVPGPREGLGTGRARVTAFRDESSAPPASPARGPSEATLGGRVLDTEDPRGYFRQPVWKRLVVIAAGPAMNVLLAFVILAGVYWLSAHHAATNKAAVASVEAGKPAASVLRKGDVILAVDGRPVAIEHESFNFIETIKNDRCTNVVTDGCIGAAPVRFRIERDGKRLDVSVRPRYGADGHEQRMLVGFSVGEALERNSFVGALGESVSEMWEVTSKTISRLSEIFTSSKARGQLHGIVGVSDLTSEAFSFGVADALYVLALISLSLAIINLFPFLPLDGGHLFWAIAEKVRGRRIPFAVMERASIAGFALVLVLAAIGFSNDIHSLTNGGLSLNR
jgi:regulator of sigma E protease